MRTASDAAPITEHERARALNEQITAALKSGQIPIELRDELRMVSPDSTAGKQFQAAMEQVAKRFMKDWDPKTQPVRFFLMDLPGVNACQVSGAEPPLIGFNVGCFKQTAAARGKMVPPLKTLDEVALIFAHEQVHLSIERRYKTAQNSKLEEGMASYCSVEATFLAGFDPRTALEWHRNRIMSGSTPSWSEILDEHPLPSHALSIYQAALTSVNRKYGAIRATPTPLDPGSDLCVAAASATYESTLQRALAKQSYSEASPAKKVEILLELVHSHQFMTGRRLNDLSDCIKDLCDSLKADPALRDRLLEPLFSAVIDLPTLGYPTAANRLLARIADSNEGYRPMGRLAPLQDAIAGFLEAGDMESAQRAARRIIELGRVEPLAQSAEGLALLRRFAFPNFEYPDPDRVKRLASRGGVSISWNRHIKFCREEQQKSRTSDITRAMFMLGVDDQRLYSIDPALSLQLFTDTITSISVGPRSGSSLVTDLTIVGGKAVDVAIVGDEHSKSRDLIKLSYLASHAASKFEQLATLPEGESRSDIVRELERISLWVSRFDDVEGNRVLLGLSACEAAPELFVTLNSDRLLFVGNQQELLGRLKELLAEGKTEPVRKIILALADAQTFSPPDLRADYADRQFELWQKTFGAGGAGHVGPFASRLLEFAVNTSPAIFSHPEKLSLLSSAANWNALLDGALSVKATTEELMISPQGRRQLQGILDDLAPLIKVGGGTLKASKSWQELAKQITSLGLETHPLGQQIVMAQVGILLARTERAAPPTTAQIAQILKITAGEMAGEGSDFSVRSNSSGLVVFIREKLASQLGEKPVWSKEPAEAIREWQSLYRAGVMAAATQYRYLAELVSEIPKTHDQQERIALYETLLTTPDARIGDPELRQIITQRWARAIRTHYGTDDRSVEYRQAILTVVDRVKGKLQPRDRVSTLDTLAKAVQSQSQLSNDIQQGATVVTTELFARTHGPLVVLEGGRTLALDSHEKRLAVIEYLSHGIVRRSFDRFVERCLEWVEVPEDDPSRLPIKRRLEAELIDLHKNFWAAPIEARALIMKEILTPQSVSRGELIQEDGVEVSPEVARAKRVSDAFDYVLRKVFPDSASHGAAAREWVRAYINGMPEYSQHIALAALLVAGQKTAEGENGVGFAIASFLESMGPAETKAGQAAQGHPKTPEDIRADLARLKTHADEPTRWELFNLIKGAFAGDARGNPVVEVGNVLGSASLYVAVQVKLHDGTDAVLSLLRPNALDRAQHGFELMEKMVGTFDHSSDSFRVMRELISDARVLAADETNTALAQLQRDQARGVYNGVVVTVGGTAVQFHVPKVLQVGKEFVLSERAPGEHFIDLPKSEHRKVLAKAIMALELNNILSGRPFDNDRHGGNCRVENGTVFHFDFGGMMLAAPSDYDLRQLGQAVVAAGLAAQSVEDFINRYFEVLRQREAKGEEISPLLKRAQKALLSIAEYSADMTKDDMLEVLVSAAAHDLHPAVRSAVESAVMEALEREPGLMLQMAGLLQSPPIRIKR